MKKILFGIVSVGLPGLVLARGEGFGYWTDLLNSFGSLLDTFVVILISLAVVYFIWNVFGYIRSANDDDKKAHAASMVWGVVGLAVIVSVWGLVTLLQSTFGISSEGAQSIDNLLPR